MAAIAVAAACSSKKTDDTDKTKRPKKIRTQVVTQAKVKPVDVPCNEAGKIVAAAWNDAAKQKLKAAFVAAEAAHAMDTFERVSKRLDDNAKQLSALDQETCKLVRAICVKRRATAMGTLVSALAGAKKRGVERALRAVYRLAPPADCADAEYMAAMPQPRKKDQKKIEQLYAHLDGQRIKLHLGRSKGALFELKAVVMAAGRVGYQPGLAEAKELQARAFRARNKLNHAQQSLRIAAKTAAAAQDHWRVASAWIELVSVLVDSRRLPDAFKVVKGAEIAIQRSKNTAALKRRLNEALAMANFQSGKYKEAIAATEAAIALTKPDDDIAAAGILFLRAAATQALKKPADAEKVYLELEKKVTRGFGPKHPMVGRVLIALGQSQVAQEKFDDGIKTIKGAVKSFEITYGAAHLHVASAKGALANAFVSAKKYKDALATFAQVLAIRTKTGGPEHRTVGRTHLDIARAHEASGDKTKATQSAKKAREVFEKAKSKGGVAAADKLLKKLTAP